MRITHTMLPATLVPRRLDGWVLVARQAAAHLDRSGAVPSAGAGQGD